MNHVWQRQCQLPDNLPSVVQFRAAQLDPERCAALKNSAELEKTAWLDTHPSLPARVRRARQRAEAGGDLSDAPVREMFTDFDGLGRLVTLDHYENDLRVPTRPDFLLSLEQFLQAVQNPPPPPAAPSAPAAGPKPAGARQAAGAGGYDPGKYLGRQAAVNRRIR